MSNPSVSYTPRPDATHEAELSALAGVYRFVLDCHAKKEVAGPRQADNLEDEKGKSRNDSLARTQYTQT